MPGAPQRRATDNHVHMDAWTRAEQHRFEDRMANELKDVSEEIGGVRDEVRSLNNRMTMLLGGLAILAFLLPIAAPFIRSLIGIPIDVP